MWVVHECSGICEVAAYEVDTHPVICKYLELWSVHALFDGYINGSKFCLADRVTPGL